MQNGSRADFFLCQTRFLQKSGSHSHFFLLWTRIPLFHTSEHTIWTVFLFLVLSLSFFLRFYIKVNASHTAVQINRSHSPGIRDFVASA